MPIVPFAFLRGLLGGLCVLFAHMAGRTWMGVRKRRVRPARFYAWLLRTAACAGVLAFRNPLATLTIVVWILSAAAFAAGAWAISRERPPDDLTHDMFPEP
jgi:hypothetical protein